MDRESHHRPAHDANEVILIILDSLLCQVTTMIIWRHKLASHVGCPDLFPVCCRDLFVEDMLFWDYPLVFHSI